MDDQAVATEAARIIRQSQGGSEALGVSLREMADLVAQHGDSQLAPLLFAALAQMQEQEATHLLKVAMFRRNRRHAIRAAESELRAILEKYPKYSRLDEVLYQLGLLEYETGRLDEATNTFERVIREYRSLPRAKDAEVTLTRIRDSTRSHRSATPN